MILWFDPPAELLQLVSEGACGYCRIPLDPMTGPFLDFPDVVPFAACPCPGCATAWHVDGTGDRVVIRQLGASRCEHGPDGGSWASPIAKADARWPRASIARLTVYGPGV